MNLGETVSVTAFMVLLAFIFPDLMNAVIDAGFTGGIGALIELMPLVFLSVAAIVPVMYLLGRERNG